MSAPVKLPRRLADASPRLDLQEPPADPLEREAYWLRRAIHHCDFFGSKTPRHSSSLVWHNRACRDPDGLEFAVYTAPANWLPSHLRFVARAELIARLTELESGAA